MTTSTTSKRNTRSGISSIRSHVIAPRRIKRRFFLSTASSGRPKFSDVRVLTSTNTSSFCRLSRQTMSTSPRCGPMFRKRILWPFLRKWRTASFSPARPRTRWSGLVAGNKSDRTRSAMCLNGMLSRRLSEGDSHCMLHGRWQPRYLEPGAPARTWDFSGTVRGLRRTLRTFGFECQEKALHNRLFSR